MDDEDLTELIRLHELPTNGTKLENISTLSVYSVFSRISGEKHVLLGAMLQPNESLKTTKDVKVLLAEMRRVQILSRAIDTSTTIVDIVVDEMLSKYDNDNVLPDVEKVRGILFTSIYYDRAKIIAYVAKGSKYHVFFILLVSLTNNSNRPSCVINNLHFFFSFLSSFFVVI